ncbi:hypothetical protein TBLA_0J01500 [Henningerozyma blattae CBS 6284]|uniref:Mitochondrial import inner membrane translocase subunit TIM44 n=1 Tax=Henningerozyma blattae (strain ATCC 34711 / CBS 6284 / DSM 70876 / NBRC 10599 / NRRL Y-10934 / UCD 77-7) TaxID=1071380 RepID=I2H9U4_HENB6|nr:hypothetical protein TBLA_0J01500 [Tetrapisispora blattae CBS 6284]CCH63146.1 hypothetical protein TBLA_0J01500 [Tetrapisispora blattae CBS 6284]
MLRSRSLIQRNALHPSKLLISSFHSYPVVLQSNDSNKTPIQIFRETFKQEWEKSATLQDQIKTLTDASDRINQSDAFKKAKDAYKNVSNQTTILSKTISKTGTKLNDAALKAWDSDLAQKTKLAAKKLDDSFEPVRNTKIYKDVSEVIDDKDNSYKYGGFISKEERRSKRISDLQTGKRMKPIKSNDEAGTALIATDLKSKESINEKLNDFKEKTVVGQTMTSIKTKVWDENDNPLIVGMRKVTGVFNRFFAETESSRVLTQFKLIDPNFNNESFLRSLREYIIPEVLEAYIKGDEKILKNWFSEAPYNVYSAQQKELRKQKIFSDGRVLDIRGVDIVTAKMLPPQDIPVIVVSCRAQEINIYKKFNVEKQTNDIVAGHDSNILMSTYAMVFTRDPEQLDNDETEGWKILEFVRGGSRKFT